MKITEFTYENGFGVIEYIALDNGSGTTEVMTKEEYERRQELEAQREQSGTL